MSECPSIGGAAPAVLPYSDLYGASVGVFFARLFFEHYVSPARKIKLALEQAEVDEGEARPSDLAISKIVQLVEEASKRAKLSAEPEISVFYGEAVVTWKCGQREVSLLSRGNQDDPKLMRYEAGQNQPSHHQVHPSATAHNLVKAIGWLYE